MTKEASVLDEGVMSVTSRARGLAEVCQRSLRFSNTVLVSPKVFLQVV